MPRNVTVDHPLVDPVAIWEAGTDPAASFEPVEDTEAEVTPPHFMEPTPDGLPEHLPLPVEPARPGLREMGAPAQAACANGHPLFHGAKFCPECGVPAGVAEPEPWNCPSGHPNLASAKFCPECGAGNPAHVAPVSGAGLAVELAAQVQGRPKPAELLTPQERAERERQHAEAVRAGSALPALAYERPQGRTDTIHLLEDGLTFAGVVWMRGQEITLEIGSERWQQAQSWWNMPEFEQVDRYGHIKFRHGPWPGKRYEDAAGQFETLSALDGKGRISGPGVELLTQAAQKERQRAGAVPAATWR